MTSSPNRWRSTPNTCSPISSGPVPLKPWVTFRKQRDDLQQALSFEQKKEELYYDAARLNYQLSNFDLALELIRRSLDLKSNYEPGYRMQCLILMATGDYPGALASANKALTLKDSPENYFYRGQVSEKMKNNDQAVSDYSKAVSRNTKYTEAYLALATLGCHEQAQGGPGKLQCRDRLCTWITGTPI